ncbi:conserved hypothetical protein [Treponema paraluiscuniculi Cuniculi A]|uniref:Uncharacterized protein n=2 Tax=Treponema paraluiscuniculi TaxID=53435 RepID=F7XSN4_TREPU|nr:hypothetical protein [Treponema paraluiscuniculi]AEH40366.1 conserved hypothetical protein [Treponema paraluiscuniculi Cuniculi A]WKC72294.1 hypothetical protein TPLL2_0423 [Treponema paraluiscuniculi]
MRVFVSWHKQKDKGERERAGALQGACISTPEHRQVFALVGRSGSGKSFRAQIVMRRFDIAFVIDDGLLIREDKIIAGRSAKQERTLLAAIRVALFENTMHRRVVARVLTYFLCGSQNKKVLILGTSEKMVRRIALRVGLPEPGHIIRIEDIASSEEIACALRTRHVEGTHVIPVPSGEVRKSYPKIFYERIKLLLRREAGAERIGRWAHAIWHEGLKRACSGAHAHVFEKSIVRPPFSCNLRVVAVTGGTQDASPVVVPPHEELALQQ